MRQKINPISDCYPFRLGIVIIVVMKPVIFCFWVVNSSRKQCQSANKIARKATVHLFCYVVGWEVGMGLSIGKS